MTSTSHGTYIQHLPKFRVIALQLSHLRWSRSCPVPLCGRFLDGVQTQVGREPWVPTISDGAVPRNASISAGMRCRRSRSGSTTRTQSPMRPSATTSVPTGSCQQCALPSAPSTQLPLVRPGFTVLCMHHLDTAGNACSSSFRRTAIGCAHVVKILGVKRLGPQEETDTLFMEGDQLVTFCPSFRCSSKPDWAR